MANFPAKELAFQIDCAPSGLGAREGMMLLMLDPVLVMQAALLLSKVLLGIVALCPCARSNVLMLKKNEGR